MLKSILTLLTVISLFSTSQECLASPPGHIEQEVWDKVSPYLLPDDHPIKPALDAIFSHSRAILSLKAMKKAGFKEAWPRKFTHLIVTTHPDVPGYIFKIYLDPQRYYKDKPEYHHWVQRIKGAEALRTEIAARNWDNTFKVPHKWIYLLPEEPSPPEEFLRKDFILVEEDMDLLDDTMNDVKWRSDWVTEEFLLDFYTLVEEVGLRDIKPDNATFSYDGRVAFIDTQSYHHWPVAYEKMTPFLSKEMRSYWKSLTK